MPTCHVCAQLGREESMLDFARDSAEVTHNRVRGFAGWPGTSARFEVTDEASGACVCVCLG